MQIASMADKNKEILDPLTALYADSERFKMHQKGLFRWSLIGLVLFLISWNADMLTEIAGLHIHVPQDNDAKDLLYFLPILLVIIISLVIAISTTVLTLIYWSRMTNVFKKVITLCSSLGILFYFTYAGIRLIME